MNQADLPLREGWDFPPPYDHSVPFFIKKCWEEASDPAALKLLRHMTASIERNQEDRLSAEEVTRLVESIESDRDGQMIRAVAQHLHEAFQARIDENEAAKSLMLQTKRLYERAVELEPELRGRSGVTIGDALEVLKRHGEAGGVSEEVMDMTVERPPPEGER